MSWEYKRVYMYIKKKSSLLLGCFRFSLSVQCGANKLSHSWGKYWDAFKQRYIESSAACILPLSNSYFEITFTCLSYGIPILYEILSIRKSYLFLLQMCSSKLLLRWLIFFFWFVMIKLHATEVVSCENK